jgi:hypothetical protein
VEEKCLINIYTPEANIQKLPSLHAAANKTSLQSPKVVICCSSIIEKNHL